MDSTAEKREDVIDPFAEDVFSDARKPGRSENTSPKLEIEENSEWFQKLPKASPTANNWDSLLSGLPSTFFDQVPKRLAKSLSKFLILPDQHSIEFVFLVNREIREIDELSIEDQKSWWLTFSIDQSDAQIAIEMTNVFAAWLVDAALGIAHVDPGREIRRLTQTELSVIEFLARNLVLEAERELGAKVFEFQTINSKIPVWLDENLSPKCVDGSLLQLNFQTVHELLPSIVKVYLAPKSLESLQPSGDTALGSSVREFHIRHLKEAITDVPARLFLGSSSLSIAEIGALEISDVVILENHKILIRDGDFLGSMEVFIGDGGCVKLSGTFKGDLSDSLAKEIPVAEEVAGNKFWIRTINIDKPWQFLIKDLKGRKSHVRRKKLMSEEEENLDENQATPEGNPAKTKDGLAVEKISVNMRVELDARRLTLSELSNLRENQILELSIASNDAVNLIVDDRSIGRGELVSVNDRLGLRITKLLR